MMTAEILEQINKQEEIRLGVGSIDFQKKHDEIMTLCDRAGKEIIWKKR